MNSEAQIKGQFIKLSQYRTFSRRPIPAPSKSTECSRVDSFLKTVHLINYFFQQIHAGSTPNLIARNSSRTAQLFYPCQETLRTHGTRSGAQTQNKQLWIERLNQWFNREGSSEVCRTWTPHDITPLSLTGFFRPQTFAGILRQYRHFDYSHAWSLSWCLP